MSIEKGREVIRVEAEAVAALEERIGSEFERAVELIYRSKGRVIVTGIGKSGIIGKKIAATLTSTGTPASYLHPAESMHGDIGIVMKDDVLIAVSKSGGRDEVFNLIPLIKKLGVPIIAITGNPESSLAQQSDVTLDASVKREACPYDLAPTASTTAALAMGDALAIALLYRKGFTEKDFAILHPGGALGRKLILTVSDLMHSGEQVPIVHESDNMREVLIEMTSKQLGLTCVVDEKTALTGILTDGDLRRLLERVSDVLALNARRALDASPRPGTKRGFPITIGKDELATKAAQLMKKYIITGLVVINDEKKPIGIVKWIDLAKTGIV